MQNKRSQKEESPLLKGEGIPTYEEITPIEVKESIPILLKRINQEFNNLEEKLTTSIKEHQSISWDAVMTPLYKISKKLRWSWGVVCHLNAVRNTNELREIHSKYQPEIIRFTNRVGQSSVLYKAIKMLQENQDESLDSTQNRILQTEVLSMKQKGVGLEGEDLSQAAPDLLDEDHGLEGVETVLVGALRGGDAHGEEVRVAELARRVAQLWVVTEVGAVAVPLSRRGAIGGNDLLRVAVVGRAHEGHAARLCGVADSM